MMDEAIDHRGGAGGVSQQLPPVAEGPVGGQDHAGSLIARQLSRADRGRTVLRPTLGSRIPHWDRMPSQDNLTHLWQECCA
jgi:hypothetical protein